MHSSDRSAFAKASTSNQPLCREVYGKTRKAYCTLPVDTTILPRGSISISYCQIDSLLSRGNRQGGARHYSPPPGYPVPLDRSSGFFSPLIHSFSLRYASKDTSSLPRNKISLSHTQVPWWCRALAWPSNQACESRYGARERSGSSAYAIYLSIRSSCSRSC